MNVHDGPDPTFFDAVLDPSTPPGMDIDWAGKECLTPTKKRPRVQKEEDLRGVKGCHRDINVMQMCLEGQDPHTWYRSDLVRDLLTEAIIMVDTCSTAVELL